MASMVDCPNYRWSCLNATYLIDTKLVPHWLQINQNPCMFILYMFKANGSHLLSTDTFKTVGTEICSAIIFSDYFATPK